MMKSFATGDGVTPLSDALPTIGIIMVPGIMGSRLNRTVNGTPQPAWDPPTAGLGGALGWASSYENLYQKYPCYPDEGWTAKFADFPDGYGQHADKVGSITKTSDGEVNPNKSKGTMYSVLPTYYALTVAMADLDPNDAYLETSGFAPKVYCAGYDFRSDNRKAAQLLEKVVDVALRECDHDKVILVAHSMGGLVSRYFARNHPDDVQAIILIGSPSIGAPEAYLYLKQFHDPTLAGALQATPGKAVYYGARLLGGLIIPGQSFTGAAGELAVVDGLPAKAEAQEFSRYNMPAVYQLAAGDMYAFAEGNYDWLAFQDSDAQANQNPHIPSANTVRAPTDCSDVDLLYANMHTGFINYGSGQLPVQRAYLDSALEFHRFDLASQQVATATQPTATYPQQQQPCAWMHPRTYVAYSDQHQTIVGIKLDNNGYAEPVMGKGDGSVPQCSGEVDDAIVGPSVDGGSPIVERHVVTGPQEHGALCEAADVIDWVKDCIFNECNSIICR